MFKVLLKKQLAEQFAVFRGDKRKIDWLGYLLSFMLLAGLIAVMVLAFSSFLKVYVNVSFDGVYDIEARRYEVLSIAYAAIFVMCVLSGVRSINNSLFEGDDLKNLLVMPIKPGTVFVSKLIFVYLRQVLNTLITVLPINLTFYAMYPSGAGYIFLTLLICLLMPAATLAVSAALSLPFYYLKKVIETKYILAFFLVTAVAGLLYYGYAYIVGFIGEIISSGDINFVFNEKNMLIIADVARNLYPACAFAGILLGVNTGVSWGVFTATVVLGALLGVLISELIFFRVSQAKLRSVRQVKLKRKTAVTPKRKRGAALLLKEFKQVLRTPSYAFSCFSMAVAMPLMVYLCMGIGRKMLQSLVMVECNLQMAVFLFLLFGVLTNTFCATNISRDGESFYIMQTMPFSIRQILGSKILFCSIISFCSLLVSAIVVGAIGFLTAGETVFVLFISLFLGEAEILFATRHDLDHPTFLKEGGEIRETRTVSVLIVLGVAAAVIFGGSSLAYAVMGGISGNAGGTPFTYLFTFFGSLVSLGAATAYFFIGLEKRYITLAEVA